MMRIFKKSLALFSLLLASNCFSAADAYKVIDHKDSLLTRQVKWFFAVGNFNERNTGKSVVMIGDSLTAGVNWEKLLDETGIANAGIGMDTSSLVLERIDVILSIKPKLAFLMIGINDFYRDASVDTVFENINMIINRLQESGVKVILLSTLHCNKDKSSGLCHTSNIVNDKIKDLNLALQRLNTKFIDLNAVLSIDNELDGNYTADGIHLTQHGYHVIRPYIKYALYENANR
ncbi:MAG: hypothetical protein K0U37_05880 [Gammaproteobacteria bacterium]|nr:hypothetical protein [Gammaproteobacteria bacterium]